MDLNFELDFLLLVGNWLRIGESVHMQPTVHIVRFLFCIYSRIEHKIKTVITDTLSVLLGHTKLL
jgi:hypothetical protein